MACISLRCLDGIYTLEIIAPEGSGLGTTNVNDIEISAPDVVRNVALIGRVELNTISGTITITRWNTCKRSNPRMPDHNLAVKVTTDNDR